MISLETMRKMWPNGNMKVPGLIEGIVNSQEAVYAKYNIDPLDNLVIAHMMAQFSHECGAGLEMVENVNYRAARAAEVWPLRGPNDKYAYRHFANAADCYRKCKSWEGDPDFHHKLINLVYGDRNGNRAGTDDGWNFIGRGLPQTTGREGYQRISEKTGHDFVENPNDVSKPEFALEVGVADFINCGCMPYARNDDVLNVTKKLNGGTVGLDERRQWLARWKSALSGQPQAMA